MESVGKQKWDDNSAVVTALGQSGADLHEVGLGVIQKRHVNPEAAGNARFAGHGVGNIAKLVRHVVMPTAVG